MKTMILYKLIILQTLNILNTQAVMNKNSLNSGNYKTLQTGTFYLNSKQPLWILEDQKVKKKRVKSSLKEKVNSDHTKPFYYNHRRKNQQFATESSSRNYKIKAEKRLPLNNQAKGLQLPRNYIPLKKHNRENLFTTSRRYQNSKFIQNLPVFDAMPGEETYTETRPIFIYTGNKGKMLFNTMLSQRKYLMQEPVPGQILYPPKTLQFEPRPLVEDLQKKINVTMIPFYAYEAIDPRYNNKQSTTTSSASSSSSAIKHYKKSKQYNVFFSPHEVAHLSQYHYNIEHTTNSPPTLEKPYNNHRLNSPPFSSTTPMPYKKFEVTYNDGEDKFQITYEDDTPHLERPVHDQTTQFTTTQAPLAYESYTINNNYYAFPLYSMSKLMEKDDGDQRLEETRRGKDEAVTVEQQRIEKYIDAALKEENDSLVNKSNEDTWFILNSRYKGPLKANTNNLHSSKYIQSSLVKVPDDMNLLKTKPMATKRTKLSPQQQMHSLYGENINRIA